MQDWIKIGARYINIANACEVHVRERPHAAKLFFVGGGEVDFDEDDTLALLSVLESRSLAPEETHRTVIQLSPTE